MSLFAFVAPSAFPSHSSATTSSTNQSSSSLCARQPPRCATVSRPSFKTRAFDDDGNDDKVTPEPIYTPEVAAVSTTICEFMNREHIRDLANYVVQFGHKFNDLSQLNEVRMRSVDAAGFTADIVSCDESSCVCVEERLAWPLGLCHNADEIIIALKHLSMACGLPADF